MILYDTNENLNYLTLLLKHFAYLYNHTYSNNVAYRLIVDVELSERSVFYKIHDLAELVPVSVDCPDGGDLCANSRVFPNVDSVLQCPPLGAVVIDVLNLDCDIRRGAQRGGTAINSHHGEVNPVIPFVINRFIQRDHARFPISIGDFENVRLFRVVYDVVFDWSAVFVGVCCEELFDV